ncbi:hypothetical protein PpBr36_02648 [Pyricularia pennisetigena]|uniref:hypothetical protein n=1 Tax=Pyricularia pennisetigena TaxID=1578925 RepID=UPI00114F597E|nr:hypothetical protein PpBr36_02648 [Pyricularia pennisetigena]TLS30924.1 hypothetical protein PpBr36_02648 [Pyricularia pennisetigena]
MSSAAEKPLIVALAYPADGHAGPVLRAMSHLAVRGYDVWLVTGDQYKEQATASGIRRFFAYPNPMLIHGAAIMDGIADVPRGMKQFDFEMQRVFVRDMAKFVEAVRDPLETARAEYPGRKIVVIQDMAVTGTAPFLYGAPPPKGFEEDGFPPVIGFNVSMNFHSGLDVPPLGSHVNPADCSEEEMRKLYEVFVEDMRGSKDLYNKIIAELGATGQITGLLTDEWLDRPDLTVQLCSPSLEYTRRELSPNYRFVGGLPMPPRKGGEVAEWLQRFLDDRAGRKLVFVTQGTVDVDYTELLIPTLQALSGREDLFVVGALGVKDAKLPEEVEAGLGGNVKVLDYFPYTEILPHTDVFVANGGYGGFMQGVVNGVPMVIAGEAKDKGEVAARMEHAGLGVNLKTARPAKDAVVAAVDKVLSDPNYKKRALELQKENENMDAIGEIEKAVLELASR